MAQLLMIREQIKNFVGKYEQFVRPASKFLLALITLVFINKNIGFTTKLCSVPIVMVACLLCSFLPANVIVVVAAAFILLHLYTLSLESVVVVGVLMLIMFLLYFRFSPKDTLLLVLTPICYGMKIPCAVPLCAGLVGSPASIISVGCGTIIYYILSYISVNANVLSGQDSANFLNNLRVLVDQVIYNKEMFIMIAAFSATIICVSLIRRLSVDHSWTIAIVTGTLLDIVIILVGDLKYNTYISISGLLLGSLVGVLVVIVIKFFIFNVDYSRTERVQFEDDEYYYYVKAVPKNTVAIPDKKVKKIKGQAKPAKKPSPENSFGHSPADKDISEYRMRRSATIESEPRPAGNKNGTKRIILPESEIGDAKYVQTSSSRIRRTDSNGLTDIERAAAAKARATQNAHTNGTNGSANHSGVAGSVHTTGKNNVSANGGKIGGAAGQPGLAGHSTSGGSRSNVTGHNTSAGSASGRSNTSGAGQTGHKQ